MIKQSNSLLLIIKLLVIGFLFTNLNSCNLVFIQIGQGGSPFTWTKVTELGEKWWSYVDLSEDGNVMIACSRNEIWLSRDGGASWQNIQLEFPQYYTFGDRPQVSADGTTIVYGSWLSRDSGITWQNTGRIFLGISRNGSTMLKSAYMSGGDFTYTHDAGLTWKLISSDQGVPSSIAKPIGGTVSYDGNRMVIFSGSENLTGYPPEGVWISHNAGVAWNKMDNISSVFETADLSGNGEVLIGLYKISMGGFAFSTDGGLSKRDLYIDNPRSSAELNSVSISETGANIVISAFDFLAISTNKGTTWHLDNVNGAARVIGVAISGNGSTMLAVNGTHYSNAPESERVGYLYIGKK